MATDDVGIISVAHDTLRDDPVMSSFSSRLEL